MAWGIWFLDWLTLTLAITWTFAGAVLVLVGWLTLPRRNHDAASRSSDTSPSTAFRVVGGSLLGTVATVLAAYTLLRGGGWVQQGTEEFDALRRLVLGTVAPAAEPILRSAFLFAAGRMLQYLLLAGSLARQLPGFLIATWASDHRYALVDTTALALVAIVGGFAGWLSSSSRWRVSGVLTYLGLDLVALGLIGFSLVVVESSTGLLAQGLGLWLMGVEFFGLALFLAYQFYTVDFIAGRHRGDAGEPAEDDPTWRPVVLVQVACYNEPPAIVRETLDAIHRLDYPTDRLTVQLVDDSTDPGLVSELEQMAAERGVRFFHRAHRRGFKGGALNDGLASVYPPPDLVAIVDADYVVDPDFLSVAVRPFRDPAVGFVLSPPAYRNAAPGTFARWYALADAYFYQVVQPVRARVQSLIFCGTMGIVRHTALQECDGWSEACVTEDAELSLRMLAKGWRGVYLRTPLGRGLAPEEMSAVRSQHRRWAFGGLQMLRINRDRLEGPDLTPRQRRDFRMGGWFWMDGLFVCALTGVLTSIVVATWFGVQLPLLSTAAIATVAATPLLLMLDGVLKIRIALRSSTPVSYGDVLGVMGFWYAIKINDLRAALRGWRGARLTFVRTPKDPPGPPGSRSDLRGAIADTPLETSIAVVLLAVVGITAYRWGMFVHWTASLPEWFLLGWLVYYALIFSFAPLFDYHSRRVRRKAYRRARAAPTRAFATD